MTHAKRAAGAVLIGALVVTGCKNGTSGSAGSGGGGGASTGAGGSGAGAGSGGGGPSRIGGVTVLQQRAGSSWTGVFSAVFYEAEGIAADCTETSAGACTIDACTYPTPQGSTPVTNRSAGAVRVAGTIDALVLTPAADATYPPAVGGRLWNDGASLSFDVAGDAVPAFTGSVVGVSDLTLQSPVIGSATLDVDRAQDLALAWAGGSAGRATVALTRTEDAGGTTRSVAVTCRFPAGAGAGTVPAAALQAIRPGAGGTIAFFNRDDDLRDISGWAITMSAISSNVAGQANFL